MEMHGRTSNTVVLIHGSDIFLGSQRCTGFYLEGTIFPVAVNQAYVYAKSDASASLGFVLTGKAQLQYDSGRVALIPPITWPGVRIINLLNIYASNSVRQLSFPGIG